MGLNENKNESAKLSRTERKRLESRNRILVAAEKLMRSRPVDSVTIQDITEAADVGHGSFYLHFKSKYEVLLPIIQDYATKLDARVQLVVSHMEDPAEVMCYSARYMGRMIVADELWRWMLQHSGVPVEEIRNTLGRYSKRDFFLGLESGRFNVPDVEVTSSYALGGYVSGLLAAFEDRKPEAKIDSSAELLLRLLGIPPDEAKMLAHKRLPKLEIIK